MADGQLAAAQLTTTVPAGTRRTCHAFGTLPPSVFRTTSVASSAAFVGFGPAFAIFAGLKRYHCEAPCLSANAVVAGSLSRSNRLAFATGELLSVLIDGPV